MSILIAEDNLVNQKIIELNLRKHQYHTITTQSGKEALKVMSENPDIELLIADVMMPELDGLTLLRKMKETPALRGIPVIMCSTMKDVDTVKKAIELGCKYYIVKPINPGQLQQKVREVLGHDKPVLENKRHIMSHLNLDNRAYTDIAKSFRVSIEEKIGFLDNHCKSGSDENIVKYLCELLESATLLGAARVKRLLETMAGKNDTDGETVSLGEYQLLQRELILLRAELPELNESMSPASTSAKESIHQSREQESAQSIPVDAHEEIDHGIEEKAAN